MKCLHVAFIAFCTTFSAFCADGSIVVADRGATRLQSFGIDGWDSGSEGLQVDGWDLNFIPEVDVANSEHDSVHVYDKDQQADVTCGTICMWAEGETLSDEAVNATTGLSSEHVLAHLSVPCTKCTVDASSKGFKAFGQVTNCFEVIPPCIEVLKLSNNQIDAIPESIALYLCLRELHLQNNSLRQLPAEIGVLSDLEILDVSENEDLAILPTELWALKNLIVLDVRKTKIRCVPKVTALNDLMVVAGNWRGS